VTHPVYRIIKSLIFFSLPVTSPVVTLFTWILMKLCIVVDRVHYRSKYHHPSPILPIFFTPVMHFLQESLNQWRSQEFATGCVRSFSPLPSLPFPFPPLFPFPLEVATLIQLGSLGEHSAVSSLSGVWGGAPAEIDFGAF